MKVKYLKDVVQTLSRTPQWKYMSEQEKFEAVAHHIELIKAFN